MARTENQIKTPRLTLSPLDGAHIDRFVSIAGDWEVARMTADIPHPLDQRAAQLWFNSEPGEVRFAIEMSGEMNGEMIGTVGYFAPQPLAVPPDKPQAAPLDSPPGAAASSGELGFFIAKKYWGRGYASEAAQAALQYGFASGPCGSNRNGARALSQFTSSHFSDNPASARVLEKLGFQASTPRQVFCKARQCTLDAQCYNLSRAQYLTSYAADRDQSPTAQSDTIAPAASHRSRDPL